MFGGSTASRVLGMVRAGLITAIVGAGLAGDAFSLANTLPNVLYLLAAGGILNAVLIPSLARAMRLQDGGQEFTDRVVTVALAGMLLLTVAVTAGAGAFVWILARTSNPEFKDLALAFSFICLPQIFFYGVFALLGQILNARGRFGAFAWGPFVANVVAVAGLVVFLFVFGIPEPVVELRPGGGVEVLPAPPGAWTPPMVWLFAGSATLSVVVQALWLVPALRRTGFHYRPRWGLRGVGLGGVSRLALWAFMGLAISQVGFFISQGALNHAASFDVEGAPVRGPAAYAIAFTLFMLPHAFVTVSVITAIFPRLSSDAAGGDRAGMRRDFRTGLVLPIVVNVAVMAFVMLEAEPIVAFLNPGIDPASVDVASVVFIVMILGLIPFGVDLLCYRTLFALEDPRPTILMQVLLTGIGGVAAIVTVFLSPWWAVVVMAAGQTLGNLVSAGTGLWLVRRRIGAIELMSVVDVMARVGLAAAAAGLVAWGVRTLVMAPRGGPGEQTRESIWGRMLDNGLEILVVGVVFVLLYAALTHLLRVREVHDLTAQLRRRLRR